MVNAHIGLVLVAPLLLSFGSRPSLLPSALMKSRSAEVAPLKCRNTSIKTPLNFVDGKLVTADSMKAIVGADKAISRVSVLCMNSADSTRLPTTSVLPGIPVVSVWTENGPMLQAKDALAVIRNAQNAAFAKTGVYMRDIKKPKLPSDMKLAFEATGTGWHASILIDRVFTMQCHVWDGDFKTGAVQGFPKTAVPPGEIVCSDDE
ncbi:MAG: hypothetical protein ABJB74_09670 [Gemmatimonas sp.]